MSRFWSPKVASLTPYTPGEHLPQNGELKLNTNESPYGPSPLVTAAIRDATNDDLRLYPDPGAGALRHAIAAHYDFSPGQVFVGNGSDEVLAHAFNAFFTDRSPVLFPDVTYSFYRTYCRLYGIRFRLVPLDADFRILPEDYHGPSGGIVIANPNAPTGIALDLAQIKDILARNPDVVVLIDEAYVDFGAVSAATLVANHDNLLVVQTFSKSRSLAGLRVGFALGQPHLIEALERLKNSFNSYPVGRIALAAALAAWQDTAYLDRTTSRVIASRDVVTDHLRNQGFAVLPSLTNFVFALHPAQAGEALYLAMRERGILARHFEQERTRDWLRISIGTEDECATLLAATGHLAVALASSRVPADPT